VSAAFAGFASLLLVVRRASLERPLATANS
jgi:hypothetical protein